MAALRISRPGIVGTTLIDLGPSVGRRTFTRGAVYGGALVVGSPRKMTVGQAEAHVRRYEKPVPDEAAE